MIMVLLSDWYEVVMCACMWLQVQAITVLQDNHGWNRASKLNTQLANGSSTYDCQANAVSRWMELTSNIPGHKLCTIHPGI
jgi:hypothetical protein